MTDPAAFRAEFPVLERLAYLNAGTDGPVPRRAHEAVVSAMEDEVEAGRSGEAHWTALGERTQRVRASLAAVLGCDPAALALTRATTDGLNVVLGGLDLGRGDEVLTTDEEHPGLLAPLAVAVRRRGIAVRTVPFDELAGAVTAQTRLVACSHVSWVSGRVAAVEDLVETGAPVLLDGAQGLGAVPVDVDRLGCDYYAASGQKWLCGPDGSGCLYVRADRIEELAPAWPSYATLADPARLPELAVQPGARRFDMGIVPAPSAAWSLAALDLLAEGGWEWVHSRGRELAARLASLLDERGLRVAPRGESTLVSWHAEDPAAKVALLAAQGIVVRDLPGRGLVRASVGAWSTEEDIIRLAAAAA